MKLPKIEFPPAHVLVAFGAWFAIALTTVLFVTLPPLSRAMGFESTIPVLEDHPIGEGWLGSAYLKSDGDTWSHCLVESKQAYRAQIPAYLTVLSDGEGAQIRVSAADWQVREGDEYVLGVQLDDHPVQTYIAYGHTKHGFVMLFSKETYVSLLEHLADGKRLYIHRDGKAQIGFSLKGSAPAMGWLSRCILNGLELNETLPAPTKIKRDREKEVDG